MARKTQRRPDKIELGVVDIHTHVLPGIDDGAEKMALSYRMLRRSYKQGVRRLRSINSSLKRNLVCARYEYLCI